MLVACVLVTAAVLQVGYWPLQQRLGEARSEVAALSANARLMTEMQREIQRLQSLPVVTRLSPLELERTFHQSAAKLRFPLDNWRLAPQSEALALSGPADFDHWVLLLSALQREAGIRALQLQVRASGQPGQVEINALLGQGEAGG
jgi:type II secretory pathway component PulM